MGKSDDIRQWNGTFAEWEMAMVGWGTSDFAELFGCTPRRIQGLRNPAGTQRAMISRADRIAMQVALEHWRVRVAYMLASEGGK